MIIASYEGELQMKRLRSRVAGGPRSIARASDVKCQFLEGALTLSLEVDCQVESGNSQDFKEARGVL